MVLCILISISSNNLFTQWVCLEINMLCFIPLLVRNLRERSILRGVKYFISQRLASLVFILGSLAIGKGVLADRLVRLALVCKLGIPPFHSWLINILGTISYSRIMLVFTVQKFLPLFIISQLMVIEVWIWMIILSLIGLTVAYVNRVGRFFVLLIFSGAINRIWIIRRVSKGGSWVYFLVAYTTVLRGLIIRLRRLKLFKINDRVNTGWAGSVMLGLHLLNLGGLPPLVGFIIKLRLLKPLVILTVSLGVGLVVRSLVILYLYVVFCYHAFSSPKNGELNHLGELSSPAFLAGALTLSRTMYWVWLL